MVKRMNGLTGLCVCASILCSVVGWAADGRGERADQRILHLLDSTQAGGHPDIKTLIWVSNGSVQPARDDCECHDVRNITIDAPEGLIPNVFATPTVQPGGLRPEPMPDRLADRLRGRGNRLEQSDSISFPDPKAVYNLIPRPGQAGLVGFIEPLFEQRTDLHRCRGQDRGRLRPRVHDE